MKPHLLIDVDGVLNPLSNARLPRGFAKYELLGFEVWLNPLHGTWLNGLAVWYDLVWATTWEHDAPRLIAPRIGLHGQLDVIEFSRGAAGTTWKLPDIERYVGDAPFAWIDDEIGEDALAWAEARSEPTLLIRTDMSVGFTEGHYQRLEEFGRNLVANSS